MAQGMAQGEEKGILKSIVAIMDLLKMNVDEAMKLLGIPENEKSKYISMINKVATIVGDDAHTMSLT